LSDIIYFGLTYGVAASGKSTLSKYIQKYNKFPTLSITFPSNVHFSVIASDEWRIKIYKKPLEEIFKGEAPSRGIETLDPKMEEKVFEAINQNIKFNIESNIHTIYDSINLRKSVRLRLLDLVRGCNKPVVCFLLVTNVPLETIEQWNAQRTAQVPTSVLRRMYSTRTDPTEQPNLDEEKWDFVYYFDATKYDIRKSLNEILVF
jgi:tRNA uridine 5-carbamoylmethylation protein Kti12